MCCFELFQWVCKLLTLEQSPPYFLGYPGYITFYFISLFFLRVTENEGVVSEVTVLTRIENVETVSCSLTMSDKSR